MQSGNRPSSSRRTWVPATAPAPRTLPHVPASHTTQSLLLGNHAYVRPEPVYQPTLSRRTVPIDENHICLCIYTYFRCGHETEHVRRDPACYRCTNLTHGRCIPESVEIDQDRDCPACREWHTQARRREQERRRREEQARRDEAARETQRRTEAARRGSSRTRERQANSMVFDTSRPD